MVIVEVYAQPTFWLLRSFVHGSQKFPSNPG